MTFELYLDVPIVELTPCPPRRGAVPLIEMPFRSNAWLADEIARLKEMFAADEPVEAIAEELERGLHGVRDKIVKLGLRRNSKRPWNDFEDQLLLERYGTVPAADIALAIGRSCASVYVRAAMLDLTEGNPPAYSEWEDAQLRAGFERGIPVAEIAELIGRTPVSVRSRAYNLRIPHTAAHADWSQDETNRALELCETGMLYSQIRNVMVAEGFPARTKVGFGQHVRIMGYSRGWGRRWTPEEDDLLRRAYADGVSLAPLRERLSRSRTSIAWRAGELGLEGTHKNKAGWRTEPVWTPADLTRLVEAYGKVKTADLAAELGRTRASITTRANNLNLVHGWMRAFTADEDRAIEIAWRRGMSMVDLSDAMKRDPAVVGKHAARIGFRFSDPARPARGPRTLRNSRPKLSLADFLKLDDPAAELPAEVRNPVPEYAPDYAEAMPAPRARVRRQSRVERVLERRVRPRLRELRKHRRA